MIDLSSYQDASIATSRKTIPEKPAEVHEGFPLYAFSSLPLHQAPATSLQTGSLCLTTLHQKKKKKKNISSGSSKETRSGASIEIIKERYVPVEFFDEYIVQISFGMVYLNQTNQNISNKYDYI